MSFNLSLTILFLITCHLVNTISVISNGFPNKVSNSVITKIKQVYGPTRIYSTGLIFYDLKTNQTLLPPIVTSENYSFLRAPPIGLPCSCQSLSCGCCAGMNFQQLNNQFCTNLTYEPDEFAITMDVNMNNNSIYQNTFSARDPPQFCIPVPVPYVPIKIEICAKFFNVFTIGRNLHMCFDLLAKVEKAPFIVLHFDCMRMGLDGVTLLKPEAGGGVIASGGAGGGGGGIFGGAGGFFGGLFGGGNSNASISTIDNVESTTSTQIITQVPQPEEQNPDIFNEVAEIKNHE